MTLNRIRTASGLAAIVLGLGSIVSACSPPPTAAPQAPGAIEQTVATARPAEPTLTPTPADLTTYVICQVKNEVGSIPGSAQYQEAQNPTYVLLVSCRDEATRAIYVNDAYNDDKTSMYHLAARLVLDDLIKIPLTDSHGRQFFDEDGNGYLPADYIRIVTSTN